MDNELTPTERRCLDVIARMLAKNEEPTILGVAKEMGCGKSGAQKFMNALRDKGRLRGPKVVGEWALTRAGVRELNKPQPPA